MIYQSYYLILALIFKDEVFKIEYKSLNNNIAIISGFNNVGVIKNGTETVLIDSGLEDRAAKTICKILKDQGLSPSAIINTHSHADHCGGNNYLQQNYGLEILSSPIEKVFIENPCLEPLCFFSGSKPIKKLENKFLQATPSKVTRVVKGGDSIRLNGLDIKIIPVAGHSIDQIGVEIDNVLFCGDSFFSEHVLEKYKLPFLIDLDKSLETLKLLKKSNYQIYIPSHGQATEDIQTIVDLNIAKIKQIERDIMSILDTEKTTEEMLKDLFNKYKISISGPQQYYLLNTTVMAYISSLTNRSIVKTGLKDNIITWKLM